MSNYTELIEELRKLASCACNPRYNKNITAAADAIETLSNSINAYADEAFKRAQECADLRRRIEELIDKYADKAADRAPDPVADVAEVTAASRADILQRAYDCVCGRREQDYGTPEDNFATIARLWSAYRGVEIDSVDVAMMMALLKIGRICGGSGSEDSFVDLAGYAACGGEIWSKHHAELENNVAAD